jgi:S1-C subfamily serine protease
MVIGVETGSIAERAGMMTGDILYSLDGKAMNAVQDLPQAMASVSPGSNISVKVSRGQNPVELHAQF